MRRSARRLTLPQITFLTVVVSALSCITLSYTLLSGTLVTITNTQSINALARLHATRSRLSDMLERVSRTHQSHAAATTASDIALKQSLETEAAKLHQAMDNIENAVAVVGTAEDTTNTINDTLDRIRELAAAMPDPEESDFSESELVAFEVELDTLAIAIDSFDAHITDQTGLAGHALTADQVEEQFLERLTAIQEQTEDAVYDAAETGNFAALPKYISKAQKMLQAAFTEVAKSADTIARDGDQAANSAQRALPVSERRARGFWNLRVVSGR